MSIFELCHRSPLWQYDPRPRKGHTSLYLFLQMIPIRLRVTSWFWMSVQHRRGLFGRVGQSICPNLRDTQYIAAHMQCKHHGWLISDQLWHIRVQAVTTGAPATHLRAESTRACPREACCSDSRKTGHGTTRMPKAIGWTCCQMLRHAGAYIRNRHLAVILKQRHRTVVICFDWKDSGECGPGFKLRTSQQRRRSWTPITSDVSHLLLKDSSCFAHSGAAGIEKSAAQSTVSSPFTALTCCSLFVEDSLKHKLGGAVDVLSVELPSQPLSPSVACPSQATTRLTVSLLAAVAAATHQP